MSSADDAEESWATPRPSRGGQHTVLLLGGGPLADPECLIGVSHRTIELVCGTDVRVVDAWVSTLDTPLFTTVEGGYDTRITLAVLRAEDVPQARRMADLITGVVSLDDSATVQTFADDLNVPSFHGREGVYWGLYHSILQ